MGIKKPGMVLFDFGGTLFYDGKLDFERGAQAVRLAADNPSVTSVAEMRKIWDELTDELHSFHANDKGFTLDSYVDSIFLHIFALTGLKFSIPMGEIVTIFDEHNSTRECTPNMGLLLDTLFENGIRTAVISNVMVSAEVMQRAVDKGYPDNHFEFIMTSADYAFCKPAPYMFKAAAAKAGLRPEDCWYCGDNSVADVIGSGKVGMTPFLFNSQFNEPFERRINSESIEFYALNDWKEMANLVSNGISDLV